MTQCLCFRVNSLNRTSTLNNLFIRMWNHNGVGQQKSIQVETNDEGNGHEKPGAVQFMSVYRHKLRLEYVSLHEKYQRCTWKKQVPRVSDNGRMSYNTGGATPFIVNRAHLVQTDVNGSGDDEKGGKVEADELLDALSKLITVSGDDNWLLLGNLSLRLTYSLQL